MKKQIIFTPQTETSRDLSYSEQASCRQSLHILLQDRGIQKYGFLLRIYRDVVASYLSSREIKNPESFLVELASLLDKASLDEKLDLDDFRAFDVFITVKTAAAVYILTSDKSKVCCTGETGICTIDSITHGNVIREIRVPVDNSQVELFPGKLSETVSLFCLQSQEDAPVELILGLGKNEISKIKEHFPGEGYSKSASAQPSREWVPVKFLNNKVLFISFSAVGGTLLPYSMPIEQAGATHRTLPIVITVAAILFALAAGRWILKSSRNQKDNGALTQRASISAEPATLPSMLPSRSIESNIRNDGSAALTIAWRRSFTKPVTSSPAIVNDLVVFGCRNDTLYALDAGTGSTKWCFDSKAGIGASPVISGDRIVAANYDGKIFCLNAVKGDRLWGKKLSGRIVSSPIAADNKVFVCSYDHYIYCFSMSTGDLLWKYKTQNIIRATPLLAGRLLICPSNDGALHAVSIGTGKGIWKYKISGGISSSPAVSASMIFAGSSDGHVYALDASSGRVKWKTKTGGAIKSALGVFGNKLYAGSNDGQVYCLDTNDGSVLWTFKTRGIILSRPYIDGDKVFIGSYDGNLYMLNSDDGKIVCSYSTGGDIFSSPLIFRNKVYFGNMDGRFYCLNLQRGEGS